MIDENEIEEIQTIEFLALAMIEDSSSEISSIENSSRLRRSTDLENLNEFYSTIVERFDEIDGLLEGIV